MVVIRKMPFSSPIFAENGFSGSQMINFKEKKIALRGYKISRIAKVIVFRGYLISQFF